MSMGNTNNPNGDSKDLYGKNQEEFIVGCMAVEEKIPGRDNDDNEGAAGSNTVVAETDIGEISSDSIEKVGYIGIVTNVLTPEIKKTIEARANKSKEALNNKDLNNIEK